MSLSISCARPHTFQVKITKNSRVFSLYYKFRYEKLFTALKWLLIEFVHPHDHNLFQGML